MTPVAAWLAYSLVVGGLVGLAAWFGEAALRSAGRPGRWAWVWGLSLSVVLPALAMLGSLGGSASAPLLRPGAVIPLAPLAVTMGGEGGGASLDGVLLAVWAMLSAVAMLYLVWQHRRVSRCGARGRPGRVDGVAVRVTRDTGPAVFGVRRPSILIPEWALDLDVRFRRLMLLHEGEHARAGDGRLVLGALVIGALLPWNLAVWWQLGRLRTAVELDCDDRVLRRVRDPLSYGGLLLEVGLRHSRAVPGVALAERTTRLERRLRRITAVTERRRVRRALWPGGAAALLLAVAAFTRDPITRETGAGPAAAAVEASAEVAPQDTSAMMQRPVFTPFTVAPRLTNSDAVAEALKRNYPPVLRDAGIGGKADVWFLIDEQGRVRKAQINQGTSYPALDEAALRVASMMSFTPAMNRDKAVPVWVSIPIVFFAKEPVEAEVPLPPARIEQVPPPTGAEVERPSLEKAPAFTPFTVAPRLLHAEAVMRALEVNYPPLLRDAGIGGTAEVWFFIDQQGRVRKLQINRSSGYPALDEAALRVAATMEFTPAKNRDEAVAVWVSIPIAFSTK